MTNKTIHSNIIEQLGGMGKLTAMVNAKYVSYDVDGTTRFYFKGNRKMNHIEIKLTEDDLYNVTFRKHVAGSFNPTTFVIKEDKWSTITDFKGIYAEELVNLFEDVTGLYLSL